MSSSHFNVTINDPFNYNIESIVNDAIGKWDSLIVSLPAYVESMNVTIEIASLDANTLGSASPTAYYYDNNGNSQFDSADTLRVTGGSITFNESRIVAMRDEVRSNGKSTLYYVVLHEFGHVLGIGVWWDHFGLSTAYVNDSGVSKKYYNGTHAVREYRNYMQNETLTGLPIEDDGGAGTAGGHPEEGNEGGVSLDVRVIDGQPHGGLDKELMTGWADGSPDVLPLSRITLGFLEDMGFVVDYLGADEYLGFSAASFSSGVGAGDGVGSGDMVCFLQGTKILVCDETSFMDKYVPIENLRPGMLVMTYKHGYVPIDQIGYRTVLSTSIRESAERSKNRLYVCSDTDDMEDLVVTGCHSLLVDVFSETEMERLKDLCGQVYRTDDKVRMMAYVAPNCMLYDHAGDVVIWHLALKHEDPLMNYGIYANKVLVESCSKRMMADFSGMTMV